MAIIEGYTFELLMACIIATAVISDAIASNRPCAKKEAIAAEAVASTAKTWQQLHQQFMRYRNCDDGAIAEGFSEAISLLLVKQWGDIHTLDILGRSDPVFRKFVIHHIDETVPAERWAHIKKYASMQCPRNSKILCRDIELAINAMPEVKSESNGN